MPALRSRGLLPTTTENDTSASMVPACLPQEAGSAMLHASMPHPLPIGITGMLAIGEAQTIKILGLKIPRSTWTDKAGSVPLTLFVHTLYLTLVMVLVSYAVFQDLQHMPEAERLSPTALNTFVGISIGCAVVWPVLGYLSSMAPSGMPFFLFLKARFFSLACAMDAA